jgi:hypothetical protein
MSATAVGLNMSQDFGAIPAQYLSTSQVCDQNTINYLTAAVPNPFYGLPQFAGKNLQGQTVARSAGAAVSAVYGRQYGEPDAPRFRQPCPQRGIFLPQRAGSAGRKALLQGA